MPPVLKTTIAYVRLAYTLPPDVSCATIDTAAFTQSTQSLLNNVRRVCRQRPLPRP